VNTAIDVILHAKVEQIALYTPIAEIKEDFRDFALEGKVEHKLAEVTLKKLVKHQPGGDGEFKATLSVVKELIHHHAEEEEEGELFPKLEKVLNETQRTQMGQRFIELKETMRSRVEELVDQSMLTPQSTTIDVTDSSKRAH
jgi:hemerythrin superfamily protein